VQAAHSHHSTLTEQRMPNGIKILHSQVAECSSNASNVCSSLSLSNGIGEQEKSSSSSSRSSSSRSSNSNSISNTSSSSSNSSSSSSHSTKKTVTQERAEQAQNTDSSGHSRPPVSSVPYYSAKEGVHLSLPLASPLRRAHACQIKLDNYLYTIGGYSFQMEHFSFTSRLNLINGVWEHNFDKKTLQNGASDNRSSRRFYANYTYVINIVERRVQPREYPQHRYAHSCALDYANVRIAS
jgi:hypothetical protein